MGISIMLKSQLDDRPERIVFTKTSISSQKRQDLL